MINRRPSSTIFLTAAFSLAVTPLFISRAEPGVPSANLATDTAPATAEPVTPAPAETPAPPPPTAPVAAPVAPVAREETTAAPSERPATYTVVSGDSLWLIAHKFKTSVKALKELNGLTTNNLKLKQVLKIPPASATSAETTPATTTPAAKPVKKAAVKPKPTTSISSEHKAFAQAQPAQDFDLATKTSAVQTDTSTLVAVKTPTHTSSTSKTTYLAAKPVSAADLAAASAALKTKTATTTPVASTKQITHSSNAGPNPLVTTPSNDWQNRFVREAQTLANKGIEYDEDWRPPGESQSWAMDCSNTARYLYKVTTGIQLPRTASDQYYYLHQQNKAWDVPMSGSGFADVHFLRENLKPGDLLFWENTYKPERQPPITHVMVFLGTNDKGQWIMAGSQTSRGGEHNRSNGGPDIYAFNPTKPCGGYSTWLGMVHHQGRFCAYGRPLEADRSKLAVAANN